MCGHILIFIFEIFFSKIKKVMIIFLILKKNILKNKKFNVYRYINRSIKENSSVTTQCITLCTTRHVAELCTKLCTELWHQNYSTINTRIQGTHGQRIVTSSTTFHNPTNGFCDTHTLQTKNHHFSLSTQRTSQTITAPPLWQCLACFLFYSLGG